MTEVFVVIVEDRHSDVDVLVFSTQEKANASLEAEVNAAARHPEDIEWDYELTAGMEAEGWVRHVPYSCESDSVTIVRRTTGRCRVSPDE